MRPTAHSMALGPHDITRKGPDLNQDVSDTVKQATGKAALIVQALGFSGSDPASSGTFLCLRC